MISSPLLGVKDHLKVDTDIEFTTYAESSPLLLTATSIFTEPDVPRYERKTEHRRPIYVLGLLAAVIVLLTTADHLADTPQLRIWESTICTTYWEERDLTKAAQGIDEALCKAPQIQGQLASLRGYMTFFDAIPSLLLSLPVGFVADKYGRRRVWLVGLASFIVKLIWVQTVSWFPDVFDIKLVWLSALSGIMSGGGMVWSAITLVMISDVTDDKTR